MKAWNFIKGNPIIVLLIDGIIVCLLLIGLCVSFLLGNVEVVKELLGSSFFLVCVFIAFIAPYLAVKILGGKG